MYLPAASTIVRLVGGKIVCGRENVLVACGMEERVKAGEPENRQRWGGRMGVLALSRQFTMANEISQFAPWRHHPDASDCRCSQVEAVYRVLLRLHL